MVDERKISQQVDSLVTSLQGKNNIREGKYITNYSRYMYNGLRRDDLWSPQASSPNFWAPARATTGIQTQFNLTQSVVDTLVSKISQANVRPYFNSIHGDYDVVELCGSLQRRFDAWLDEQHAQPKSVLCLRDASIFDVGVMYCNPFALSLERIQPWKYFLDPAEFEKGFVSRAVIWEKYYPVLALKDSENPRIKRMIEENCYRQGQFARYFDLYNGYYYEQFDGVYVSDPLPIKFQEYSGLQRRPFVEIFYRRPVKGFLSRSLADDVYPIQRNIDNLVMRLDEATRNAISQMIFVNTRSGLKATTLQNGVTVYPIEPSADGQRAVEIVTPPPIDPAFFDYLNGWIEKGYEMIGLSQLSAQSKKPAGLDSGKALDTMEDIESDRFNTQLQQFTHFQVDAARVCIDCFPADEPILRDDMKEDEITWGDARKAKDRFKLQFSAADALSKDPEEKRREIEFYIQQGFLDRGEAIDKLQLPDLEEADTIASASYKHCMRIIQRAVKKGEYDYDEAVNLEDLMRYSVTQLNVLCAKGDKQVYIDRIKELIAKVDDDLTAVATFNAPPPPAPAPEPLRDYALDAGQIEGLRDTIKEIEAGILTADAGFVVLTASFPKIPQPILQTMIATLTKAAPSQAAQPGAQNV